MSEDTRRLGITTKEDLPEHPAYIEIHGTKAPKIKVERTVNRSREVKIGSR